MVTIKSTDDINIETPFDSLEGKLNQVRVLLNTIKGTVPLNRKLGIDARFVDKPSTHIRIPLLSELQEQIRMFAPEFSLKDLIVESDGEGRLIIAIILDIKGGGDNQIT